jgi:hypothetical protein
MKNNFLGNSIFNFSYDYKNHLTAAFLLFLDNLLNIIGHAYR